MQQPHRPLIPPNTHLPELTLKAVILGLLLALVLAISNTYLALKIGVLTASSIPAAILSMGILRWFRRHNILENNLVQTAASAGEAIAGGVVYTVPALIIIRYWMHFDYWTTFTIAFIGGTLGVLFTIPIRQALMTQPELRFPEGQAIAQVLQSTQQRGPSIYKMLIGGALGAVIEFLQNGVKIVSDGAQYWIGKTLPVVSLGFGFSPTLIGAGYLMGFSVGASILLGAIIGNGLAVPIISHLHATQLTAHLQDAATLMAQNLRYVGIGAMLVAGLFTLLTLLKPLMQKFSQVNLSPIAVKQLYSAPVQQLRTERDIPLPILLLAITVLIGFCIALITQQFHLQDFYLQGVLSPLFIISCLIYIIVLGFVFSVICGYFSGLVGVAASPGSSVAIASVLIAALLMQVVLTLHAPISQSTLKEATAITIIMSSIVMGAACVANNNSQDLKVGYLLGATPWKQQVMLLLGSLVSCLVIPAVMQLLFDVYGISNIIPRPNMDLTDTLPAPPAAAMAAVAEGVFHHDLPWDMMLLGAIIAIIIIVIRPFLPRSMKISAIGVAIGVYLPLTSSTPLFFGSLLALWSQHWSKSHTQKQNAHDQKQYHGMVIACGLVAGSAITNVLLAIPVALFHDPELFSRMVPHSTLVATILGVGSAMIMAYYFYHSMKSQDAS